MIGKDSAKSKGRVSTFQLEVEVFNPETLPSDLPYHILCKNFKLLWQKAKFYASVQPTSNCCQSSSTKEKNSNSFLFAFSVFVSHSSIMVPKKHENCIFQNEIAAHT